MMSKQQNTESQSAGTARTPDDHGSDLFLLRLDPKYTSKSIGSIYRIAGSATIVCFFLIIVVRINNGLSSSMNSYAYPIRGLTWTIMRGFAATAVLGSFGYFLSFLNYRALSKRSLRISVIFLISLVAFFLIERLLVKPLYYNIIYCIVLMSLPLFTAMIFAFRNVPVAGVILSTAGLILFSEFCLTNLEFAGELSYMILFLLCAIPLFVIAIARKCFCGSRLLNFAVFLIVLILGLSLLTIYHHDGFDDFRKDAQQRAADFLDPESTAQDKKSNTYEAAVIHKLNSKAALFGHSQIRKDEINALVDWAYNVPELEEHAVDPKYAKNLMSEIDAFKADPNNLSIKSLLPVKYDESYLLSYSAWKIGVIPTALLSLVLLTAPVLLLISSLRRKHPFALLLSAACSLMLLSQTILYILGNLGYSFRLIPALPFLPMNIPALGANLVLVGLIAACHRDGEGEEGDGVRVND